MRVRTIVRSLFFLTSLALAGCSWVRDGVIDQAAGFPASSVINDVKKTSDEYQEEKQAERVEELENEYEEFLRSRDRAGAADSKEEKSIMVISDDK